MVDSRTAPFLGKGVAFPLRLSPTGGLLMSEGLLETPSIAVQYLPDGYTLDKAVYATTNHISESIAHILQVIPGERDTLPEFGSRTYDIIFDPNNIFTQQEFEAWAFLSTEKWEKRARIPENGGVVWKDSPDSIDAGESRSVIKLDVIKGNRKDNLVAPFVTEREVRNTHYPTGTLDDQGHDWVSRYRRSRVYFTDTGEEYIRPRTSMPILPASTDDYYQTVHGDTWLLIAHKVYNDFRLWWVIAETYYQDLVNQGAGIAESMDTLSDPEPGTILRIPSRTRVLMEMVA